MNLDRVDKIARATLYEGYILYPYRASSIKNQQRFNFGCVYPPAYSQLQMGTDLCTIQTECLIEATGAAELEIHVRFLHLRQRDIARLTQPCLELPPRCELEYQLVDSLQIGSRGFHTWQEAIEREVLVPALNLRESLGRSFRHDFHFEASDECEPLRASDGQIVALALRTQRAIEGSIEVTVTRPEESLFQVQIAVNNVTSLDAALDSIRESSGTGPFFGVRGEKGDCPPLPGRFSDRLLVGDRHEALSRSLVSTHTIIGMSGGQFVSLLDPPDRFKSAAASCKNIGTWPVLVGETGQRDTMLSSPIILYDYPQVAAESAGDLFDSAEIDEILTLRIMTLTAEEKREMCSVDDRAREILQRTELMPPEQLMKMHGAMRSLRPSGKAIDQTAESSLEKSTP